MTKKIKVVHIVTRLDFGGAQFNTLYTATHLPKANFEVYLIAGYGGTMAKCEYADKSNIIFLPQLRREINPIYDIKALFKLSAMLKEIKPDIVHTHSSKAGVLGRIAAALAGIRAIVHTFHGFGFNPYQAALIRSFYILLEKICAKFSNALVFVSRSNMEYARLLSIGSPWQYRLIRSGIKLSSYPARADKRQIMHNLGLKGRPIIILSIGNTKPQKNPKDFILAAAELLKKYENLVFIFAGGGSELEKYKKMTSRLKIDKRCLFIGWRQDSAKLLACADIYIMTSLWEGLPRSLVEAFASGLCAVCYAADGVSDILADGVNGYLIEKKNLSNFINKLSKLIEDPSLRQRLSENARRTDLSEFDIDYMVKQQQALYLELMHSKKQK